MGIMNTADPRTLRAASLADNQTMPVKDESGRILPGEAGVLAIIPLTGEIELTLPPLGPTRGQTYFVLCKRAAGTYVNGNVKIADAGDSLTAIAENGLVNSSDYLAITNYGGMTWRVTAQRLGGVDG